MDYDAMEGLEDNGPRVTVREVRAPGTLSLLRCRSYLAMCRLAPTAWNSI